MCILYLSEVLMYGFHYDLVKNKYSKDSRLLFTDTDNLMYEIETEDVYEDFSKDKEMFDFSNFSAKSKYYDNSNKIIVVKMKDKTAGAAIEEYVGFKSNMYSFLVNGNNDHRKPKGVIENTVATISHNEIKDVLLNNKCLRHPMNRVRSKNHKIGTYAVNKYFFIML